MAETLVFTIQPPVVNERLDDNGGNWQYVGATATDGQGTAVQLIAMKRENSSGGHTFSASMLTATILYPAQDGGVPPNLTLQGCTT